MQEIYYSNPDESILVSYEKQLPPLNMSKNDFHNSYEIYYLLSGERYYFIKDRTYHLVKGSLVFINTNELHRTFDAGAPNWERILINFKPEFISAGNTDKINTLISLFHNENRVLTFSVKEKTMIEELLFKMLSEARSAEEGFEQMLATYLMQLLVFSNRISKQQALSTDSSIYSSHTKAASIVHYINSHYMEPLTLQSMAGLFYLSPYYLCKVFKGSTGFTLIEYLNQVRVKEAQTLLRKSRSSVMEISGKVGFGSVSHFGRVFKEISGVSPLAYKKLCR